MQLKKIGVTSPGDMGQAIAMRLKAAGFEVYTALEGRSARTAELDTSIQRAAATFRWTGSWHTVFITVDRFDGLPLTNDFEAQLRREIDWRGV